MDAQQHWERVYQSKEPEQLSWFQSQASLSLQLIARWAPERNSHIVDVGAGASTLVDGLLADGYSRITVLDLSGAALDRARQRLGAVAAQVNWQREDVLTASIPAASVDVWHDRAVFHFLTDPDDRARYVAQVRRAVRPGGAVMVATFAEDGPTRCSGLDVRRYSPTELHNEFGLEFQLLESRREEHRTPWGAPQAFTYCFCRYEPAGHVRTAA
jgi:SAM-dependent methyltransferase